MALLVTILLIFLYPFVSNAGPPAPGYNPSSKVPTIAFDQGYSNLWGPQHQKEEQGTLSIWLDKSSGSGYKSKTSYRSGYFSTNVKLQTGYTAGVITCFYLSNDQEYPGYHDEIDIEFLGTTLDKPYVLQTNVFMKGTGDGNNTVGREMRFHLWFDPTQDFHNYAILWNPDEIIWYVDDIPIRWYQKKSDDTFPQRPMWTYGSIWDASDWATEGGKYKCDYKYQPFIGLYNNFRIGACKASAPESCNPPPGSPNQTGGLSQQQATAMAWVQKNNMVYNYCKDPSRDHSKTPEC